MKVHFHHYTRKPSADIQGALLRRYRKQGRRHCFSAPVVVAVAVVAAAAAAGGLVPDLAVAACRPIYFANTSNPRLQ
jgi:hypothetical protein